jgi:hypothetical protein
VISRAVLAGVVRFTGNFCAILAGGLMLRLFWQYHDWTIIAAILLCGLGGLIIGADDGK